MGNTAPESFPHDPKWREILSLSSIRIIFFFIMSAVLIVIGFGGFRSSNVPTPLPPHGPVIEIAAGAKGVTALITKADLSPSTLNINMRVTVPQKIRKKPLRLVMTLGFLKLNRGARPAGWITDPRLVGFAPGAQRTFHLAAGLTDMQIRLPLIDCDCYEYKTPYLAATGLRIPPPVPTKAELGGMALPGLQSSKGPYSVTVTTIIEQEQFDFSSPNEPGGGAFTFVGTYLPVRQTRPADWLWQNVTWRTGYYGFVAESIAGKSNVDNQTFIAGLLLGIGGSGIILAMDRFFGIWADRPKS